MVCFAACQAEPQPADDDDPEEPVAQEANLKSLVAYADGINEYKADILGGKDDRRAEFTVYPEHLAGMANATLEAKVSEGASVNVEAGKSYDLTAEGFKIVVTSADQSVVNEYRVVFSEMQFTVTCTEVWEKYGSASGATTMSYNGSSAAFSGKNIVYLNGDVYNLSGNKMGSLDLTGCPEYSLYTVVNDDNGVLVGAFADGWQSISDFWLFAWLAGYYDTPTLLFHEEFEEPIEGGAYRFPSCGGALGDKFLYSMITGGQETGVFRVLEWIGAPEEYTEYEFDTPYDRADGNWTQMIAPATGDVDGWWFIGDDAPWVDEAGFVGYQVYGRSGMFESAEGDIHYCGTLLEDEAEGYDYSYGNYATGHVNGFTYSGTTYVAACTTGWESSYITVQSNDPADEEHYLLPSYQFAAGIPMDISSQYYYDADEDTGYIVVIMGADGSDSGMLESANTVALFSIQREAY